MTILTGTTDECAKDFFGRYQWEAVRLFVAKYAGVEKSTVRSWYKGTLPKGAELIKLRVLLDLLGYQVAEFKELPPPCQQFAKAIALDLIEADDAKEELGYENIQSLYRMVLRNQEPLSQKWYRLERWLANNTADLDTAIKAFQRELEVLPKERGYQPPLTASHPMTESGVVVERRPAEAPREPKPAAPEPTSLSESLRERAPGSFPSRPQPGSPEAAESRQIRRSFDHQRPMVRALVYSLMTVSDLLDAIDASPDKDNAIVQLFAIHRPQEVKEIARKLDRLATTE